MAALSVTTIILSVTDECPGLAFYILEVIINTSMILEVGIRFVAFGRVRTLLVIRVCPDQANLLPNSNSGNLRITSWISFLPSFVRLPYLYLHLANVDRPVKKKRFSTLFFSLLGTFYSSADLLLSCDSM